MVSTNSWCFSGKELFSFIIFFPTNLLIILKSFVIGECPETSSTTSEKVTLESEDSLDALSDSLKSETELPEDVIPPVELTPFQESVLDCKKIVDSIRKEEFGIGMELEEEAQGLMIRHQERIGRSLKRLSEELYSKDTHFVLELIQNADDNDYLEDVEPSLVFVVDRSEVKALNNERGFSESNIRALCDVGRSTKGKHKSGYIGKKLIIFIIKIKLLCRNRFSVSIFQREVIMGAFLRL